MRGFVTDATVAAIFAAALAALCSPPSPRSPASSATPARNRRVDAIRWPPAIMRAYSARGGASIRAPERGPTMRITRIYTGADAQSHFEEIDVPLAEGPTGRRSALFRATGFGLRESGTRELDYHPAPQRQLVITLEGTVELKCGDGTRRAFGPGAVFLADDTTGQGHRLRNLDGTRRSIVVALGPDFDLDSLRR